MTVLSSAQRKTLERVVVSARRVVERACADRIAALGIAQDKAPAGLSDADRKLRVGLRARSRQLGSVDVLVTEAGFEHWHRMLFARLLADNGLLVDDESAQPVSMEELAEYAVELGESDVWEVAARFASAMLPGIFKQGDPILEMRLPVEVRQKLEELLDQLPVEITTAEDSLGWVYQYWQKQRKDEVNASEVKIGGADLAPVTQLFTEDYMVRFLLENSLGAWWAARHPESPLVASWEFLRKNDEGSPAAGAFDEWPRRAAEVTVMDPCCGSGHFLVAAFGMLWRMRSEEEGLKPADAQDAVLRENLFGLELDQRCTQIAMFALALEAWKAGGLRDLPIPNVACSGIPARAPLSEWTSIADGDARIESGLARLHALFADADTLGSLIDPVRVAEDASLESVDWKEIAPHLQRALMRERVSGEDPAAAIFGDAAAGIARAADYLSRRYALIATNVPYLKSGNMGSYLRAFAETNFPLAKSDLANVFVECLPRMLIRGGTLAAVTPQSWLFLTTSSGLRLRLLTEDRFDFLVRVGKGAFVAISGEVVNVALVIKSATPVTDHDIAGLNLLDLNGPDAKRTGLCTSILITISQSSQRDNPDHRISLTRIDSSSLLSSFAWAYKGLTTGDDARHRRSFWELVGIACPWKRIQTSPDGRVVSGCSGVVALGWMLDPLLPGVEMRGTELWGRRGVHVHQMGNLPSSLYLGVCHDQNAAVLMASEEDLPAVWAFVRSGDFSAGVREIDDLLKVTNATLVKVPFDLDRWRETAAQEFPNGLPDPISNDPTQWLFKGTLSGSREPLQLAVARLLGYRWPDQEPDALDAFIDDDGIVCLPAVGGEQPAEQRLRGLLAVAFGDAWSPDRLDSIIVEAGGKPGDLEGWLRRVFFKDHCKVFANRPFIWQIWDGTPDGFSALINYHRLDRKLLERLIYGYLGSWWMERQRDEVRREVPGAEVRLAAAEELKAKLELILVGEAPYDIFVRWKSLAEQPIGWEPDLDDGVRMNIRPFVTAGVLRTKPSINWNKDRGKNPDGSERHNDLHFTLAEKHLARQGSNP